MNSAALSPWTPLWGDYDDADLVLTSLRTQVFHPEGVTKLGLDLATRKLVIVKSTQHFHAGLRRSPSPSFTPLRPARCVPTSRRFPTANSLVKKLRGFPQSRYRSRLIEPYPTGPYDAGQRNTEPS
jgi:hypothetical protein